MFRISILIYFLSVTFFLSTSFGVVSCLCPDTPSRRSRFVVVIVVVVSVVNDFPLHIVPFVFTFHLDIPWRP